jgi:hypothetical protein
VTTAVLGSVSAIGPAEGLIVPGQPGAWNLNELQINGSAPTTAGPFGITIFHRADKTLTRPDGSIARGDGRIILRFGTPAPVVPDLLVLPIPPHGPVANHNFLMGWPLPFPSTAPVPTVAFIPIRIGPGRTLNLIPAPGWTLEVFASGESVA